MLQECQNAGERIAACRLDCFNVLALFRLSYVIHFCLISPPLITYCVVNLN